VHYINDEALADTDHKHLTPPAHAQMLTECRVSNAAQAVFPSKVVNLTRAQNWNIA